MSDRLAPDARDTREGPLVLADISGYTTFVATTELEHSQRAITLLLEGMIDTLAGRLDAAQVEGDGVFFVGEGLDPRFLSWLDDLYVAFSRMVREMSAQATHPCRACQLLPTLTMKALAHYGRYQRRRVGPSDQVHGADVILPHRLAKNSVPSREYVLVTPALADRLSSSDRARLSWREENGVEFGRMRVGYYDLSALRERIGSEGP